MNYYTLFCFLLFGMGSFYIGLCINHWNHARKGDFRPGRHLYPTRKTPAVLRFGAHTEESYAIYPDPSQQLMLVSKKKKQVTSISIGQYLDDHPDIKTIQWQEKTLDGMKLENKSPPESDSNDNKTDKHVLT